MTGAVLQLTSPNHFSSLQIVDGDATPQQPSALAKSQLAASAQTYDKTTQAALAFFQATDNTAIKAAFDHLLAIVFNSRGSLFLKEPGLTSRRPTALVMSRATSVRGILGLGYASIRIRRSCWRTQGETCKLPRWTKAASA
jgi:hypothetical protein